MMTFRDNELALIREHGARGEHPFFKLNMWRLLVAQCDLRMSYWQFVHAMLLMMAIEENAAQAAAPQAVEPPSNVDPAEDFDFTRLFSAQRTLA
jgi:hypothetical protein